MTKNLSNKQKLELVDLGLCITAQDYYQAAMSLKQNDIGGKP